MSTLKAAIIERSRLDGSQMLWVPVRWKRQGDELLGWQWAGYVHGHRWAVVTRERRGGAWVVYAAKRYVGRFPWMKDAKDAAMLAAAAVPFQIVDLISWLLKLVARDEPAMACVRNGAPARISWPAVRAARV